MNYNSFMTKSKSIVDIPAAQPEEQRLPSAAVEPSAQKRTSYAAKRQAALKRQGLASTQTGLKMRVNRIKNQGTTPEKSKNTRVKRATLAEFISPALRTLIAAEVAQEVARIMKTMEFAAPDALAAAKARGKSYMREEWSSFDNATLTQASAYAGRSDRMINVARQNGELYALLLEGNTRGFRYPLWQFDADGARLAKVLAPFHEADANCWVVHNFFNRPHSDLDGRTPREVILDPTADIEQLSRIAHARFQGDQGAA